MKKIGNYVLLGIVFGLILGLFFAFLFDVRIAIFCGLISGLLFGTSLYFFANSKTIKSQIQIESVDQKDIIHHGNANHFMNREAVGGKLYLLLDKLQFKSHRMNIQNHGLEIPIDQISEIQFFNSLGLIPNGLAIKTSNGQIEKFVVENRKKWKSAIEDKRK